MKYTAALSALLLCAACAPGLSPAPVRFESFDPAQVPQVGTEALSVDPPVIFKNLAVYLIRRPGAEAGAETLTLEEGLRDGTVTVSESGGGSVNELAIENRSELPLYVQAGDVVRGGRQDRAIAVDFVVPPHSKPVAISAFCVERGRWSPRAGDDAAGVSFSASGAGTIPSKEIKLAARLKGNQSDVWKTVAESNAGTAARTGTQGALPASGSLELMQSNARVRQAVREYTRRMEDVITGQDDVVGFAFSINGEINTVEIYGTPTLFAKLWPKLLNGASAEALAKRPEAPVQRHPTARDVDLFISQDRPLDHARAVRIGPLVLATYDKPGSAIFETWSAADTLIRCQMIKK